MQARYLEAAVNGVLIGCLYAPNGNPQPGPKFDYKLAWLARLARHAKSLRDSGVPVVLAGDYNVVPTPADIYATTSYDDDALVQPESRDAFAVLIDAGLDRRDPRAASARDDLHVLGLHAQALGAQCRAAHRPSAPQRPACASASSRRTWTATCADGPARATTRRCGSRSRMELS